MAGHIDVVELNSDEFEALERCLQSAETRMQIAKCYSKGKRPVSTSPCQVKHYKTACLAASAPYPSFRVSSKEHQPQCQPSVAHEHVAWRQLQAQQAVAQQRLHAIQQGGHRPQLVGPCHGIKQQVQPFSYLPAAMPNLTHRAIGRPCQQQVTHDRLQQAAQAGITGSNQQQQLPQQRQRLQQLPQQHQQQQQQQQQSLCKQPSALVTQEPATHAHQHGIGQQAKHWHNAQPVQQWRCKVPVRQEVAPWQHETETLTAHIAGRVSCCASSGDTNMPSHPACKGLWQRNSRPSRPNTSLQGNINSSRHGLHSSGVAGPWLCAGAVLPSANLADSSKVAVADIGNLVPCIASLNGRSGEGALAQVCSTGNTGCSWGPAHHTAAGSNINTSSIESCLAPAKSGSDAAKAGGEGTCTSNTVGASCNTVNTAFCSDHGSGTCTGGIGSCHSGSGVSDMPSGGGSSHYQSGSGSGVSRTKVNWQLASWLSPTGSITSGSSTGRSAKNQPSSSTAGPVAGSAGSTVTAAGPKAFILPATHVDSNCSGVGCSLCIRPSGIGGCMADGLAKQHQRKVQLVANSCSPAAAAAMPAPQHQPAGQPISCTATTGPHGNDVHAQPSNTAANAGDAKPNADKTATSMHCGSLTSQGPGQRTKGRKLPASLQPTTSSTQAGGHPQHRNKQQGQQQQQQPPHADVPSGKQPALVYNGAVRYACNAVEVDWLCRQLLEAGPPGVVGFDLEWRPTFQKGCAPNKAALIQIAYAGRTGGDKQPSLDGRGTVVLLLHIWYSGITPKLQELLQREDIGKVGVNIGGDVHKLLADYSVEVAGTADLSDAAHGRQLRCVEGITANTENKRWSLAGLVDEVLRLELPKPQQIRVGNWEKRPLDREQQQYAALDAFACLLLHWELQQLPKRMTLSQQMRAAMLERAAAAADAT